MKHSNIITVMSLQVVLRAVFEQYTLTATEQWQEGKIGAPWLHGAAHSPWRQWDGMLGNWKSGFTLNPHKTIDQSCTLIPLFPQLSRHQTHSQAKLNQSFSTTIPPKAVSTYTDICSAGSCIPVPALPDASCHSHSWETEEMACNCFPRD